MSKHTNLTPIVFESYKKRVENLILLGFLPCLLELSYLYVNIVGAIFLDQSYRGVDLTTLHLRRTNACCMKEYVEHAP